MDSPLTMDSLFIWRR